MNAETAGRGLSGVVFTLCMALWLTGCEDGGSSSGGAAPEGEGLTGKWNVRSDQWRRTLLVTQTQQNLNGTVVEPSGDTEELHGTAGEDGIVLMSGDVTGTGTRVGDTLSGTYVRENGDSGSWTATRAAPEG